MTPNKGFVNLAIGIIVAIALALGGGYYVYQKTGGNLNFDLPPILSEEADENPEVGPSEPEGPTSGDNQAPVACTMEAKICPDGSAVGRVGPNCEFAACPVITWKTYKNYPYPSSWIAEDLMYLSPGMEMRGEEPIPNGLMFRPTNQINTNDQILVGGHMMNECPTDPQSPFYTHCVGSAGKVEGFGPIYTASDNPQVLEIFDLMVEKLRAQ